MLPQVLIVVSLFHLVFAQTISPTTNSRRFTVEDPDLFLDTVQPPDLKNNDPSNKNDIDYYADLPSAQDGQEDVDDSVNFGGMLLDPDTFRALFVTKTSLSSDLLWVKDKSYFTPEVPYGYTSTGKQLKEVFREAMREWSTGTCLKFRSYVEGQDNHILAFTKENTCSVHLGKQKMRVQYLTVSDQCSTKQHISMSLGVALGFLYQRLRSDRDEYITMNYPSVDPEGRHFFDKVSNKSYYTHGIPFDYTSVMQESPLIFSMDSNPTMIAKDIQYQGLLGRSKGLLSFYDKKFVNIHYRCISKWLSSCGITKYPCMNGGYTGSNCACVCPPGTTGKRCQKVQGDYYQNKLPSCNQIITEDTLLLSPNHPSNIKAGTVCVYQMKAASGQTIHFNFTRFHLEQSAPNCLDASLTVFTANDVFTVCEFDEVTNTIRDFDGSVSFLLDVRNGGSEGFQVDVRFLTNGQPTKTKLLMAGGTRLSWSMLMLLLCPLVAVFLK